MKALVLSLALALTLAPRLAEAQVAVDIRIGFPAPPPLVVVSPGVQVVPDYQEEVFFVNGWYWVRRDDAWYRTRDHRGGWVFVQPRYVPVSIVRIPPGRYRHWHKEEVKAERRAAREERKEWREREREDRKQWKEREKEERKEAKEHGRGRGHRD